MQRPSPAGAAQLLSWATALGAQRRLVRSAVLACKDELLYGSAHHRSFKPLSLRVTLSALRRACPVWHSDVNLVSIPNAFRKWGAMKPLPTVDELLIWRQFQMDSP